MRPYLAFVAGKYRDPRGPHYIRENIEAARKVAVELWQAGFPTICCHLNSSLMDGACPDEVWLEGALAILARCDLVVTVPGWEESEGAKAEVDYACQRGIRVCHTVEESKWRADIQRGIEEGRITATHGPVEIYGIWGSAGETIGKSEKVVAPAGTGSAPVAGAETAGSGSDVQP